MREVILTVGPQCAGKSTFCEKAIQLHPEIILISRDAICVELFGSAWLNPYMGGHLEAWARMWLLVEERFKNENVKILLDAWNGWPGERREITRKLRKLGVGTIEAWHFVTPVEMCLPWFFEREKPKCGNGQPTKTYYEERYREHHQNFHRQPVELDQGFDVVTRIDASKQSVENILPVQASLW